MNRRKFLTIFGSTIGLSLNLKCDLRKKPPNVIFILADDLGYGDLGSFGQEKIRTPNIDRMAKEGMRFTNYYAGSAVCAPSRCTLMTGYHTGHCNIRWNKRDNKVGVLPLAKRTKTVAEVLKAKTNYTTALFGRWHLGGIYSTDTPWKRGFDKTFGPMSSLTLKNAHYYRSDLYLDGREYTIEENLGEKKNVFMSDIITEKAIEFIERSKKNPFLLYLPYQLVHAPMQILDLGDYEDKDWPEAEKIFAAMLTKLDHYVGLFLDAIKNHGLDDNTIVIFTSDNGPHHEGGHDHKFFNSNGPLRGCKRDLYEGGIRIPFIARWPGRIRAGAVEEHLSAFWDFMPTVCELAGIESPSVIDGLSYLPALLGKQQPKHDYLYWERPNSNPVQAIRKEKWKALRFVKEERIELYDLTMDIGENKNVADQHPDVAKEMIRLMDEAHEPSADFPIPEINSKSN